MALTAVRDGKIKSSDEYRLRWRFVAERQTARQNQYLMATPSKIRAGAIADLCGAYKTNFAKRSKNPHHEFDVRYRSRKMEQSISLQKDSFVKQGSKSKSKLFFPQSIKDTIKTSPIMPSKFWTSIQKDCRLIRNVLGEIYLAIPIEKPTSPAVTDNINVISLDPGVRTFLTGFAPASDSPFVKIGDQDIGRIMRLSHHADKLISLITTEKNYKMRVRLQHRLDQLRMKIQRLKADCHHRVADYLTKTYDTIIIPVFETSKMARRATRKISSKSVRAMMTWSHYAFRQKLIAKATERGKRVILVTEEYTSKTCCLCGNIKYNLGGSKTYRCASDGCRLKIDRDWNGAINIFLKHMTECTKR